jgi:hypothetical protein
MKRGYLKIMYFLTLRIKIKLKSMFIMSKAMYEYTKSILERVLMMLFCKELEKHIKTLLPYEWNSYF